MAVSSSPETSRRPTHLHSPAGTGGVVRHRRHRRTMQHTDIHGPAGDRRARADPPTDHRPGAPHRVLGTRPARALHRAATRPGYGATAAVAAGSRAAAVPGLRAVARS